jgi:copper chaperone CopZ
MPRKITTLMLKDAACISGVARTIEKALREVPGVSHAYVNPSTEPHTSSTTAADAVKQISPRRLDL